MPCFALALNPSEVRASCPDPAFCPGTSQAALRGHQRCLTLSAPDLLLLHRRCVSRDFVLLMSCNFFGKMLGKLGAVRPCICASQEQASLFYEHHAGMKECSHLRTISNNACQNACSPFHADQAQDPEPFTPNPVEVWKQQMSN